MTIPTASSAIRQFLASMPASYRTSFGVKQLEEHARLTLGRGRCPVRVGVFRTSQSAGGGEALVCIVAEDRPGLLAVLSAGFVMSELNVSRAVAYTRITSEGRAEAVDFFWVRPVAHALEGGAWPAEEDVDALVPRLEATLGDLVEGRIDVGTIAAQPLDWTAPERATRVRFLEGKDGGLAVLEVETVDRAGLLFCLAQALHSEGVNIAKAEVQTQEARVLDRFTVTELDGRSIGPGRRLAIQVAVLAAIQAPRQGLGLVRGGPEEGAAEEGAGVRRLARTVSA